ncbi:hypothetical protein M758_1G067200 [Ceratodon purpureus]|uniref:RING-type E3 ubiquitin transferase n=1 Tax=Ceratodon purpureus TaxID=3225 RepID=A0A8T0J5J5_CERPU|nr:hypothetical protein KC19_1G068600 [Ceratodon purpureus]KAG0628974.1 hypothetical protein M758_1G067200 [Ceratodon purpureus]
MGVRISGSKLWLLLFLHATALNHLQPCSADIQVPLAPLSTPLWRNVEFANQKYSYLHNETQIAMAMAEAELALHDDGGRDPGSLVFPNFDPPPEDGCNWETVAPHLSFHGTGLWGDGRPMPRGFDEVEILAVDSCADVWSVPLGNRIFEFCSERWVNPKPGILKDDRVSSSPQRRSFKVFVKIRAQGLEILADGVYFLATGKMHLVGCTRWQNVSLFDGAQRREFYHRSTKGSVTHRVRHVPRLQRHSKRAWFVQLLNRASPEDCAVSATLQYPPLSVRWNSERVVKYSIRSSRAQDDPLYFPPIERSMFVPYELLHLESAANAIHSQRRLETCGRSLILVLGLASIAFQIKHGNNNEESLPFVSLMMLAIQLAHHLSQISMFKDIQIREFRDVRLIHLHGKFANFIDNYGTIAWADHVPYQAMTMTAIIMYIWIFHKVDDRRRIMKLRVRRGKPGAKDPPSDWRVMYSTVAIFAFVGFLLFAIGADHYSTSSNQDSPPFSNEQNSPFVSSQIYEAIQAQWGFINNFTGLVVSLFLVPQLLGNMQWEVDGRPLSVWFYAGIPLLQSLPRLFSIAKHFQLLPIFSFYDPYLNSVFGVFEDRDPWWQVGVVLCSALQALAVHFQFARAQLRACKAPEFCDLLESGSEPFRVRDKR